MPKIRVGRKVMYLEIFEIDTDEMSSARDDLDLCKRILYSADPAFVQKIRSTTEVGRAAVKLVSRTQHGIHENPVLDFTDYQAGLDECPCVWKGETKNGN